MRNALKKWLDQKVKKLTKTNINNIALCFTPEVEFAPDGLHPYKDYDEYEESAFYIVHLLQNKGVNVNFLFFDNQAFNKWCKNKGVLPVNSQENRIAWCEDIFKYFNEVNMSEYLDTQDETTTFNTEKIYDEMINYGVPAEVVENFINDFCTTLQKEVEPAAVEEAV